jgi:hypothetical protein
MIASGAAVSPSSTWLPTRHEMLLGEAPIANK